MSSLYDTTMKRETMVQKFEQLLAQYRAYFEEAGIMEGEYDLLRSILSDMQTGNWMTSPYYKKDAI